ncbi:hypothetical protein THAOC_36220, partial [Thalassiosira oceanica]
TGGDEDDTAPLLWGGTGRGRVGGVGAGGARADSEDEDGRSPARGGRRGPPGTAKMAGGDESDRRWGAEVRPGAASQVYVPSRATGQIFGRGSPKDRSGSEGVPALWTRDDATINQSEGDVVIWRDDHDPSRVRVRRAEAARVSPRGAVTPAGRSVPASPLGRDGGRRPRGLGCVYRPGLFLLYVPTLRTILRDVSEGKEEPVSGALRIERRLAGKLAGNKEEVDAAAGEMRAEIEVLEEWLKEASDSGGEEEERLESRLKEERIRNASLEDEMERICTELDTTARVGKSHLSTVADLEGRLRRSESRVEREFCQHPKPAAVVAERMLSQMTILTRRPPTDIIISVSSEPICTELDSEVPGQGDQAPHNCFPRLRHGTEKVPLQEASSAAVDPG